MVLEHIFPEDWLERKVRYAFLLAFIYSAVAIIVARLLFAANSGLVAVMVTSLLLLPYLQKLFAREDAAELHEKGGFRIRRFFLDNWPAIKVYGALFLGIYFAFMAYSFILPYFGYDIGVVFREQLSLEAGIRGNAFSAATFVEIFLNNWWVLLACFALALLTGDGAIFFITWNASTWGAIFGYRALAASLSGVGDPLINLITITAITFPHLILEGGAYILAAIAGGVISDDVVSESDEMPHFLGVLLGVILGYVFLAIILVLSMPNPLVRAVLHIAGIALALWFLSYSFEDAAHKKVYLYNYRLFFIAIGLYLIGAFVETLVLSNSSLLLSIYAASL